MAPHLDALADIQEAVPNRVAMAVLLITGYMMTVMRMTSVIRGGIS
jgi:hypothetical protein